MAKKGAHRPWQGHVPPGPGVYMMKGKGAQVIYIGKAKSLKNRIKSYFAGAQDPKTARLVESIMDIEFVVTDTEEEAFILESNLIKRYRPRYNIELKDQQRYTYLRLTAEKYPRLLVARRMRTGKFVGKGKTFGPFTHGSSKLLTIGMLRKSFKIRICKTLPKKACLEYHLGNCEAPCEFAAAQRTYAKNVAGLEAVLAGGDSAEAYEKAVREQMSQAASNQRYEEAMEARDTLQRLGSLGGRQNMERVQRVADEDYVGIASSQSEDHIMVLRQSGGVIRDRERFSYERVADNNMASFLYQYYTTRPVPRWVVASKMPPGRAVLERALSKRRGKSVGIVVPSRGRRRQLVDLVLRNAAIAAEGGAAPALEELRRELGLRAAPHAIECFDISNHGADFAVGAMSRLAGGEPDKGGYRKFMIKTVSGQDDYAMIAEVVRRRYARLARQGQRMPDLVLIDGGPGQLGAAVSSLRSLRLQIACASLAKQEELVFLPDKKAPVEMARSSPALQVLMRARDEAHRFGVSYNRAVRRARLYKKKI